ncbi:M15 family metallopeptidase, partial [Candidatus Saccharibacteria bacterium]|nr:M15 family metallopeptidase [Candidatus Saccharibacteria bacterium]
VRDMYIEAANAGLRIGGYGYRSYQRQVELRRSNCGPTDYDIYQKPSGQCTPDTAKPGYSNHESGEAIDITINGSTIKSRSSEAFQWLSANAGRFGLKNLPSEPWHWSTNGR